MLIDRYTGLGAFLGLAEKVEGRKKLQKAVYLAQRIGFPCLDQTFDYHWYGPYSDQLASELGEMTMLSAVTETQGITHRGFAIYTYELTPEACRHFNDHIVRVSEFRDAVGFILQHDARFLELAATLDFFIERGLDFGAAQAKVREFKADQQYTTNEFLQAEEFLRQLQSRAPQPVTQ